MTKIYELNAFTDGSPNSGNKAGVCFINSAEEYSTERMQSIAYQLNYSETVFVVRMSSNKFNLIYFTPLGEVDICGHATIAAFRCLELTKRINDGSYFIQTKAGVFHVALKKGTIMMEQKLPEYYDLLSTEKEIVDSLGISQKELSGTMPITLLSTGLKDIFIPLKDKEILFHSLKPDFSKITKISKANSCIGYHLFAVDSVDEKHDAYTRNFAPLYGINEECATGSSSGALACYLFKNGLVKDTYHFKQGGTGPSGIIKSEIESKQNKIDKVYVGGRAELAKVIEI